MDPILTCGGHRLGVAALLDELLHTRHRLLRKHVHQQPDHRGDEDHCDSDGHCCGVAPLPPAALAGEGAGPALGGTAPGSTMYVRIAFGLPSYWNCSSGIGSGFVSCA